MKVLLLTSDMIGRNGHMRWPKRWNNQGVGNSSRILQEHHQSEEWSRLIDNWTAQEGLRIRAQDILPLLVKKFSFRQLSWIRNLPASS